jgi:hypothetical protein
MVLFLATDSPFIVAFGGVFWSGVDCFTFNFCIMAIVISEQACLIQIKRQLFQQEGAKNRAKVTMLQIGSIWREIASKDKRRKDHLANYSRSKSLLCNRQQSKRSLCKSSEIG